MSDPTDRRQLEPVHAAVANAHPLGIKWFGDDDVPLAVAGDPARVAEPCHASEAATFFVRRRALLDAACQADTRAPNRLDGMDRGGDAGLLIGGAAAEDQAIAQVGRKRVNRPA